MARTLEELRDFFDEELSWRRKELTLLRSEISGAKDRRKDLLLRAGSALLYAHWEGAVKALAQKYVDFVSIRKLSYKALALPFLAMACRKHYAKLKGDPEPVAFQALLEEIVTGADQRAHIGKDIIINTRDNLSTRVFDEITRTVGLTTSDFVLPEKLLDEGLLKSRNTIAHGRYLHVTQERYEAWHSHVVAAMELLAEKLEEAAVNGKYMRPLAPPTPVPHTAA